MLFHSACNKVYDDDNNHTTINNNNNTLATTRDANAAGDGNKLIMKRHRMIEQEEVVNDT